MEFCKKKHLTDDEVADEHITQSKWSNYLWQGS